MMSMKKQRLLVVDDEAKLRELLKSYLSEQGFHVDAVEDGESMNRYLVNHDVDLVILDLMLPGEDGLSIGRRLRARSKLPIIFLSACGEEIDRIVGLEIGADDYLPKPFNPRELLARIRSVLRRSESSLSTVEKAEHPVYIFGPFCLETDRHRLMRGTEEVLLSNGEFTLLKVFLEHPNRVMTRDALLAMTKGYERSPVDRSIDICVGRLRHKIEPDPAHPIYLRTLWGAGYLFSPDT
jgi:DNA-binding response OmpR family regulator